MNVGKAPSKDETVVHDKTKKGGEMQAAMVDDHTVISSKRPDFDPDATDNDETELRVGPPSTSIPEELNEDNKTIVQPQKKTQKTPVREDRLSMSTMQLSRRSMAGTASAAQNAYLEVFGLKANPVGFDLSEKETLLGRNQECHLVLPLYGISRVHARIYYVNDEYYLEDMNSTNGTYVNGIKILKCALRNNDQIEIGEAKIIFMEERVRKGTP